jgi:hypothetical protein
MVKESMNAFDLRRKRKKDQVVYMFCVAMNSSWLSSSKDTEIPHTLETTLEHYLLGAIFCFVVHMNPIQ